MSRSGPVALGQGCNLAASLPDRLVKSPSISSFSSFSSYSSIISFFSSPPLHSLLSPFSPPYHLTPYPLLPPFTSPPPSISPFLTTNPSPNPGPSVPVCIPLTHLSSLYWLYTSLLLMMLMIEMYSLVG